MRAFAARTAPFPVAANRGAYNKAEYLSQRWEMLQRWADLVDAQIEEGRKVVIGRYGKAFQAA